MLRLGLGREKYSSSSGPRQGCSMLEPSITGPWYRARIEALILKRNGTISLMSRPGLKSLGSIACFQLNMTLYCEMSLHSPSRGTSLLSSSAPQLPKLLLKQRGRTVSLVRMLRAPLRVTEVMPSCLPVHDAGCSETGDRLLGPIYC